MANNPHQDLIDEISRLSNEQIAAKEIYEIVALAIPRGEADAIARNLRIGDKPVSGNAVRSWRNDPNVDNNTADPWGRGSPAEHCEQFITALYSRFPTGAWLLARYFVLRLANQDAIHGREEMLNALEVNDEIAPLVEQMTEILRKRSRKPK